MLPFSVFDACATTRLCFRYDLLKQTKKKKKHTHTRKSKTHLPKDEKTKRNSARRSQKKKKQLSAVGSKKTVTTIPSSYNRSQVQLGTVKKEKKRDTSERKKGGRGTEANHNKQTNRKRKREVDMTHMTTLTFPFGLCRAYL